MIDFPASPAIGQVFTSGVGPVYVWDGTTWNVVSGQLQTALSRNLIVNPGMAISQENGTTAGTASGYYVADQWRLNFVASGAAVSANVSYTNINPSGSPGRISFKTTTAKATLASGDYAGFVTILEGVRVYPLFYPGSAPLQAVLRFSFNGPAGTYSVGIRNPPAYTVAWTGQFTIAAGQANTDTTQVLVIPSPPTGYAWGGGSVAQIEIWFMFACLGSLVSPALGWQAGNFIAGPGQFNLLGTVNNQAQIWDVGFYADPNKTGVPPSFQVPDYTLDLFECQRYWRQFAVSLSGYGTASGDMQVSTPLVPAPRISPTAAVIAAGTSNNLAAANIYPDTLRVNMQIQPSTVAQMAVYNRTYSLNARM
jgi:hypothetical protein